MSWTDAGQCLGNIPVFVGDFQNADGKIIMCWQAVVNIKQVSTSRATSTCILPRRPDHFPVSASITKFSERQNYHSSLML